MRLMSFALTTPQVRARTKTVTRRLGWTTLKPGDLLQPVEKVMGFKPGEKVKRVGKPIRIVSVRREPLGDLEAYGRDELAREGFPKMSPLEFITMFSQANKGCNGGTPVTRIEFEYVD